MFCLLKPWHKLPAIRGFSAELCKINKITESVVTDMEVQIRNTVVKLDHKFVLVPLVYN